MSVLLKLRQHIFVKYTTSWFIRLLLSGRAFNIFQIDLITKTSHMLVLG